MKIGVIVAMEKELEQLRELLHNPSTQRYDGMEYHVGRVGPHDIIIQKCGIGKVNSAFGTLEMVQRFHPDAVVSTGCAGGACIDMEVGDVVVSAETAYHDVYCGDDATFGQVLGMPPRYAADAPLLEAALRLRGRSGIPPLHAGLVMSGDWFVNTREKMGFILDRFPEAIAVDMESCSIAQVCHRCSVPFISFRIVSDIPLKDTKATQYFDFWDRMAKGSFLVTSTFLGELKVEN